MQSSSACFTSSRRSIPDLYKSTSTMGTEITKRRTSINSVRLPSSTTGMSNTYISCRLDAKAARTHQGVLALHNILPTSRDVGNALRPRNCATRYRIRRAWEVVLIRSKRHARGLHRPAQMRSEGLRRAYYYSVAYSRQIGKSRVDLIGVLTVGTGQSRTPRKMGAPPEIMHTIVIGVSFLTSERGMDSVRD
jgi:hypothetical protein